MSTELKKHSELAEDILISFEDSCRQIGEWQDPAIGFIMLKKSFRGVLERCIHNLKEAEASKGVGEK